VRRQPIRVRRSISASSTSQRAGIPRSSSRR
jgi:hypothetical protein